MYNNNTNIPTEITELYQFINNNTIEYLIEYGKKVKIQYNANYNSYSKSYLQYCKKKKLYKHLIKILVKKVIMKLKLIDEDELLERFKKEMPPARYDDFGGRTLSFEDGIKHLKNNINHYITPIWTDDKSWHALNDLIKFRLTGNKIILFNNISCSHTYKQTKEYFDDEILSLTNNEVFVDCGGYIGDSSLNFIKHVSSYKKIYLFEPDKNNFLKAKHNLRKYPRIQIECAGVGEFNGNAFISGFGQGAMLNTNGNNKISVISLDEFITEPISFIKMDIEVRKWPL